MGSSPAWWAENILTSFMTHVVRTTLSKLESPLFAASRAPQPQAQAAGGGGPSFATCCGNRSVYRPVPCLAAASPGPVSLQGYSGGWTTSLK